MTRTVFELAEMLQLDVEQFLTDPGRERWWSFNFFGLEIHCYNFQWRKKAIFFHDLHHVVTGYPCTMIGEIQVATWEFAAGRFPNLFANLFCLPLVALGMLLIPKKTFAAYRLGSSAISLFGVEFTEDVRLWPVERLRALTRRKRDVTQPGGLLLRFLALVAASVSEVLLFPAVVAGLWIYLS